MLGTSSEVPKDEWGSCKLSKLSVLELAVMDDFRMASAV